MSSWNAAYDLLKSVTDDEDEVEKADGLTESQQSRLGAAPSHGAKALRGQTLKPVQGERGKGLVHNRPGKLTITPSPKGDTSTSYTAGLGGRKGEAIETARQGPFKTIANKPTGSSSIR
jgi:hypothetical protein